MHHYINLFKRIELDSGPDVYDVELNGFSDAHIRIYIPLVLFSILN